MTIRGYSTTAGNNTGLFPENMQRANVNNSARQLQADLKGFANELPFYEFSDTITWISGTSFSTPGDLTATLLEGSRVRASGASTGTIDGRVTGSVVVGPNTVVTVEWDSGVLVNETLRAWLNVATVNYFASAAEITTGTDTNKPLNIANLIASLQANQSLSNPGYEKTPAGRIRQWGTNTVSDGTTKAISFPIPFPATCVGVQITPQSNAINGVSTSMNITAISVTTTGFTASSSYNGSNVPFFWEAIGW